MKRNMSVHNDGLPVTIDGLVSIREAAEFLSVCPASIYNLNSRGQLPFVKIGGSRRIPRRALVELAERNLIEN
jgi:excisionase family DNA binding protein